MNYYKAGLRNSERSFHHRWTSKKIIRNDFLFYCVESFLSKNSSMEKNHWSISPLGKPKTFHSLKVRSRVQSNIFFFRASSALLTKQVLCFFSAIKTIRTHFFSNFYHFQWSWLYQSIHDVHHTKPQHGYSPLSLRKIGQERLCVGARGLRFLHKLSEH